MRKSKEIDEELRKICEKFHDSKSPNYEAAAVAAQALAWVLGDEMSASDYLQDLKDNEGE